MHSQCKRGEHRALDAMRRSETQDLARRSARVIPIVRAQRLKKILDFPRRRETLKEFEFFARESEHPEKHTTARGLTATQNADIVITI